MTPDIDPGPLYLLFIKPYEYHWRELMLDLGAPLDAEWEVWTSVYLDRVREDLPYDVTETVSIQDLRRWRSGEAIGETEVRDSDLELFDPAYVMRTRIFLFDEKPSLSDIPPISPLFPDMPFLEMKNGRLFPSNKGSISFHFETVPPERRQEEWERHLQWWNALNVSLRGVTVYQPQNRRLRIPRIPPETFLSEGLAAAEAIARMGEPNLHLYLLAKEMNRDRETVSNAAKYYKDEWEAINKKFSETKVWWKRYKKA
jgi:hypothetical protein